MRVVVHTGYCQTENAQSDDWIVEIPVIHEVKEVEVHDEVSEKKEVVDQLNVSEREKEVD